MCNLAELSNPILLQIVSYNPEPWSTTCKYLRILAIPFMFRSLAFSHINVQAIERILGFITMSKSATVESHMSLFRLKLYKSALLGNRNKSRFSITIQKQFDRIALPKYDAGYRQYTNQLICSAVDAIYFELPDNQRSVRFQRETRRREFSNGYPKMMLEERWGVNYYLKDRLCILGSILDAKTMGFVKTTIEHINHFRNHIAGEFNSASAKDIDRVFLNLLPSLLRSFRPSRLRLVNLEAVHLLLDVLPLNNRLKRLTIDHCSNFIDMQSSTYVFNLTAFWGPLLIVQRIGTTPGSLQQLRSLAIPECILGNLDGLLGLLRLCTNLVRVKVSLLIVDNDNGNYQLFRIFKSLPPTLEAFRCKLSWVESRKIGDLHTWCREIYFPRLRVLDLQGYYEHDLGSYRLRRHHNLADRFNREIIVLKTAFPSLSRYCSTITVYPDGKL